MKSERDRILDRICALVLKRHFNAAAIQHSEWVGHFDRARPRLREASPTEFDVEVNRLLRDLQTSHVVFYSEAPSMFQSQHTIGATFRQVSANGGSTWIFLDVFPEGAAERAGVEAGDLLVAVDGEQPALSEPPRFGIGRSHRLTLERLDRSGRRDVSVSVPVVKAIKARPPMVEPKSVESSFVAGGVGVLRVLYFPGSLGLRFYPEIDSAVQAIVAAGATRLILDLRGNIGGSLGFARLASHLCAGALEIGFSVTPARNRFGYRPDALPRVAMPFTRVGALLTLARFAFRDKKYSAHNDVYMQVARRVLGVD